MSLLRKVSKKVSDSEFPNIDKVYDSNLRNSFPLSSCSVVFWY